MQCLFFDSGRRITPFGDRPGDAQFAETTVGETMRRHVLARGMSMVASAQEVTEDCVVIADYAFASNAALGGFLSAAFGASEICQLALCHTASTKYITPVSSVVIDSIDVPLAKPSKTDAGAKERARFDIFYVPKGQMPAALSMAKLREAAKVQLVGKREVVRHIRMPTLGDAETQFLHYPVTSTVAAHVEHWVHILWLNHLAFGIRWGEVVRAHRLWTAFRALLAFPWNIPSLFHSMVRRGKNVRIHPTAHVEGSIIGDNVVIGARASVRNSILADGVEIGDHATVLASTVGKDAYITPRTFFVWSVAYPKAVVSNFKVQMSVLGRASASSIWAGLIDAKFNGDVDVFKDGEKCSTERPFLGSCVGHDSYIGAKVLLLPGREIPNGTFIAMRPDELITEVPADLPVRVPVVRHEGTLVPLSALKEY